MAKQKDLKKKLKAADKRRKQRAESAASLPPAFPPSKPPPAKVDVTSLIAAALLEYAAGDSPRDAVAVNALRNCLRGSLPAQGSARGLSIKINDLLSHSDVSVRAFRDGLQQLIDVATQHGARDIPDAFLQFLAVINTDRASK